MSLLAAAAALLGCLIPPVDVPVVDGFRPPTCAFCPGNRGLEYDTAVGTGVIASASGTVTFSAVVAGTRYVVIADDDGLTATYGKLATTGLAVGRRVSGGGPIGTTTSHFYFGLRRGDTYIDPAPLLGQWTYRARLIPVDGSPGRAPGSPRLACSAT